MPAVPHDVMTTSERHPRTLATARRLRWVILALALAEAGWLAFDGARALIAGDYVTPSSGPYAGQLGPWAELVRAIGIDPRSTFMKSVHAGLGVAWLVIAAAFALQRSRAWTGMLVCAVLALWYLPIGTILGIAQIAFLLHPAVRGDSR